MALVIAALVALFTSLVGSAPDTDLPGVTNAVTSTTAPPTNTGETADTVAGDLAPTRPRAEVTVALNRGVGAPPDIGCGSARRPAPRVRQDSRHACRLPPRQSVGGVDEICARRRLRSVYARSPFGDVQVDLDDAPLLPDQLHAVGQRNLESFPDIVAAGP